LLRGFLLAAAIALAAGPANAAEPDTSDAVPARPRPTASAPT
jgi:hypothetical protein